MYLYAIYHISYMLLILGTNNLTCYLTNIPSYMLFSRICYMQNNYKLNYKYT